MLLALTLPLLTPYPGQAREPMRQHVDTTTRATPTAPTATPSGLSLVDHNVQDRQPALRAAIRASERRNADFVFLQEACARHLAAVRRARSPWSVSLHRDHNRGCPGGTAVIARSAEAFEPVTVTFRSQYRDPRGFRTRSGAACLVSDRVLACSTHVYPFDPGTGRRQITQLTRWLARVAGDRTIVVGGDFNRAPSSPDLDPMYAAFTEVSRNPAGRPCRCGPHTHGTPSCRDGRGGRSQRIDYLFVSRRHFGAEQASAAQVLPCATSDHHAVGAEIGLLSTTAG